MNDRRCASQFFGTWAIEPDTWSRLSEVVLAMDMNELMSRRMPEDDDEQKPYEVMDGVALVGLSGMMTKHSSSLGSVIGGGSTTQTRRAISKAAADPFVSSIMMVIDSPGGTVKGTSELAAHVDRVNRNFKPVDAFVDDLAASAAYWVASQARKVYANRGAKVGAIGTYGVVRDTSKADEKAGIKTHVIKAGKFKGAGHPGTKVTDEQLEMLQNEVDATNDYFIQDVARGRGMSVDKVQELADGSVFVGDDAVQKGLVDVTTHLDAAIKNVSQSKEIVTMSNENVSYDQETVDSLLIEASDKAKAEGFGHGRDDVTSHFDALNEAFGTRSAFVIEHFKNGSSIEVAAVEFAKLIAKENEELRSELKSKSEAGIEPVEVVTSKRVETVEEETVEDNDSFKAKAEAEWKGMTKDERGRWSAKSNYVTIRVAEMDGTHKNLAVQR